MALKPVTVGQSGEAPLLPALGLDPTFLKRARNVMITGEWMGRRRHGYRLARAVATTPDTGIPLWSYEHLFDGLNGGFRRLYVHNDTIYDDDGAIKNTGTTGFVTGEPVSFIPWNDRVIVWSHTKRLGVRYSSGTVVYEDFHIAAPSAGAAASAGAGTALSPGTYTYVLVSENNNAGTQSGPSATFQVTLTANVDVTVSSIPNPGGQVTHIKIYRTEPNGVVLRFVKKVTVGTASTTDNIANSALSVVDVLPRDAFGTPFTSAAPTAIGTSVGGNTAVQYRGMLVAGGNHTGGASNFPKRLYHTQPGFPDRWSENYYVDIPCSGPITAFCEQGGVLIVASESDMWAVYGTGQFGNGPVPINDWRVEKLSGFHGIPNATSLVGFVEFAAGISTCGPIIVTPSSGVRPLRMPDMERYILPRIGSQQGAIGFNPRRRELWFALPVQGESTEDENRRVIVYPIDPGSEGKVAVYDLHVSAFMPKPANNAFGSTNLRGNDLYFGDYLGNLIQAEYSDGDGVLGNESYVVLADTIALLGGSGNKTVTPTSAGSFPGSNGLRGVSVVGIPVSGLHEPEVRKIVSNTAGTFTLDYAWTNVAAGDTYFLGGILDDRITGKLFVTEDLRRAKVDFVQMFWTDITEDEPS